MDDQTGECGSTWSSTEPSFKIAGALDDALPPHRSARVAAAGHRADGGGPTALDNWIRTVAGLSREHWAPQRRTGCGLADRAGDFYLDFTGRIPLVMTIQARLQQYGPLGPVRFRIDGYHPAEGEPLLQALASIRTEAEFDHRQEQRGHAAKAAEQRREEAEKRRRDAEWAREEWFEKRERKMKKLARQWDEAATADDR